MTTPPKATPVSSKAIPPEAMQPKAIAKFKVGDVVEYLGGRPMVEDCFPSLVVGLKGKVAYYGCHFRGPN